MAFIETYETIQSQLHLSDLSPRRIMLMLLAVSVLIAILATFFVSVFRTPEFAVIDEEPVSDVLKDNEVLESFSMPSEDEFSAALDDAGVSSAYLYVHVSGCVASPGVYRLSAGSRVIDAVRAAGGFEVNAAEGYLNQARLVSDGEHIAIPSIEEIEESSQAGQPVWLEESSSTHFEQNNGLVNINTATLEQLKTLEGIGEATARKVIAFREETGAFSTPEDLMKVSGIGQKKFNAIADRVCV